METVYINFNNNNLVWKNLLDTSNPSECLLTCMYLLGIDIEQDEKKAIELLDKKHCSDCITVYGLCFQHGKGVKQDFRKAFMLYQEATEMNNSTAMTYLSNLYFKGKGTFKDFSRGIELLKNGVSMGNSIAINALGEYYGDYNDPYPEPRMEKVMELYQQSADLGNSKAMSNLGFCYLRKLRDTGDRQYKEKAIQLFTKAMELGDNKAPYGLKERLCSFNDKQLLELYKKCVELKYGDVSYFLKKIYDIAESYNNIYINNIDTATELYIYTYEHGLREAINKMNHDFGLYALYKNYLTEKKIQKLKDEMKNMFDSLLYAPGMRGAVETQKHFEELVDGLDGGLDGLDRELNGLDGGLEEEIK